MKLITRPECPHCDAVKEWLEINRQNLKIEIECLETKVADSPYGVYSDKAPSSHAIIDYFQSLA